MSEHELKTDPDVFDAVIEGIKRFEIRKNDRGFSPGDSLILRRTEHTGEEMAKGAPLIYSGGFWTVEVDYVLHGPVYGLKDGWCIMSISS